MTSPDLHSPPIDTADSWRVEIPMPVHGPDAPAALRGEPAGWLSLNNLPVGTKSISRFWRAKKAWRLAARDAYRRHRVPQGLDRIYLVVEFRFPVRNKNLNPSNYEPTVKPIIDALQPEKTGMRRNPKTKKLAPFVDYGWGVVPDDAQRHVVRGPELLVGEPLGRTSPIKGMVIITITPFPKEDTLC